MSFPKHVTQQSNEFPKTTQIVYLASNPRCNDKQLYQSEESGADHTTCLTQTKSRMSERAKSH